MTGQLPVVGERYRLVRDVERYPHFLAQEGQVGTIVHSDDRVVALRMEDFIPGAEAWDNEVHVYPDDGELVVDYMAPVGT